MLNPAFLPLLQATLPVLKNLLPGTTRSWRNTNLISFPHFYHCGVSNVFGESKQTASMTSKLEDHTVT